MHFRAKLDPPTFYRSVKQLRSYGISRAAVQPLARSLGASDVELGDVIEFALVGVRFNRIAGPRHGGGDRCYRAAVRLYEK